MGKRSSTDAYIITGIILFILAMFVMKMRRETLGQPDGDIHSSAQYYKNEDAKLTSIFYEVEGKLFAALLFTGGNLTDYEMNLQAKDPQDRQTWTGYVRLVDEETGAKHFVNIRGGDLLMLDGQGGITPAPGAFVVPESAQSFREGHFDLERYPELTGVAKDFQREEAKPIDGAETETAL